MIAALGLENLQKLATTVEPVVLSPSVQQYFANPKSHERLLADKVRLEAFRKAIYEVVKPGDVVMDIGAGTGILSQYAIEAGARKVYLIEENVHILEEAKDRLARYSNKTDLIFFNKRSTILNNKDIPEKVNVIISETIGSLGINEGIIDTLYDAKRFLSDEGYLLPFELRLMCAAYHNSTRNLTHPCVMRNEACSLELLSKPSQLFYINFEKCYHKDYSAKIDIKNEVKKAEGIAIWFEASLGPSVLLCNLPLWPTSSWGVVLIPFTFADNEVLIKMDYKCLKGKKNSFALGTFNETNNIITKLQLVQHVTENNSINLQIYKEEAIVKNNITNNKINFRF